MPPPIRTLLYLLGGGSGVASIWIPGLVGWVICALAAAVMVVAVWTPGRAT